MDFKQFTTKSQEAIQKAAELAVSSGNPAIETTHLLKGILLEDEHVSPFLLQKLGANQQLLTQKLEEQLQKLPKVSGETTQPYLSGAANQALTKAKEYLKTFGDVYVALEHLLLAVLARLIASIWTARLPSPPRVAQTTGCWTASFIL